MRIAVFFLTFILFSLISAAQVSSEVQYIAAPGGAEYHIYPSANGTKINPGNFFKMQVIQLYRGKQDTILYDSRNYSAVIQSLDTTAIPDYIYAALKNAKNNDSVVIRILVDSVVKKSEMPMPPFFEYGNFLYYALKIEAVFETKEMAEAATKEMELQMAFKDSVNGIEQTIKDNLILGDYFKTNSLSPFKAPRGTYINITTKGTGKNATALDKVKVNYTGKTLAGKVFDSNTDIAFGHIEPLEVNLAAKSTVIPGWEEGLLYLNKGAKAVLYIPSALAFGSRGAGADIGPNEILIFDIELLSIAGEAAAIKPKIKSPVKPQAKSVGKKPTTPVKKSTTKKAGK